MNNNIGDKVAKAIGAAAQISLEGDGLTLHQKSGDKFAERRNCGCFWVYLARQPLVAPCDDHLRLLDPENERPLTGTRCGAEGCGEPQFKIDSGTCCSNGHGGAPALEDEGDG